jgi:hypothetical protein
MIILAIDPGPEKSGWVLLNSGRVMRSEIFSNDELIQDLPRLSRVADKLAIEMVASYGMPVGREIFETCVWIGRFLQAWPGDVQYVYRKDVKLELCGSPRAKDANIRQALIDRIGPPGTKKNPGPTYGVTGDMWSALAVAVVAAKDAVA